MIAWQYAFRELQRRRGRALLSLFSVVIAVAAIVAVTSATATTRLAYQQVFETLAGRADLEVVAQGGGHFHEGVAEPLRSVAGIRTVLPVFQRATILYAHGKKAKALAVGIEPGEAESIAGYEVAAGRLPERGPELAIGTSLAAALQIQSGEQVRLLTSRGMRRYRVVGLINIESAARLRQGSMLLAPLAQLQGDFRSGGAVDSLDLFLAPDESLADAKQAAAEVLPAGLAVRKPSSRSGLAEQTLLLTQVSLNMASALSFTTAVFIVLSVFIMNVGERRKQLSILRAVGATRRQVMGMVTAEALLMGIAGTAIGIPIGIYGGGFLIDTMANMLNTTLPRTPDLRWAFGTGALLGPLICLLSTWYPARLAAKVSPLEGMRPVVDIGPKNRYLRSAVLAVLGLLLAMAGGVATAYNLVPIWVSSGSIILALASLVLLMPMLLRPVVELVGYPIRGLLGLEGEMSQRTIVRRVTRSSLTIGVLFIAVSAAIGIGNAVFSITDDVRTWYERTVTADFLLRPMMPDVSGQESAHMNESLGQEVARLAGVTRVDGLRFAKVVVGDAPLAGAPAAETTADDASAEADATDREAMLVARDFHRYQELPLDLVDGDDRLMLEEFKDGAVVIGTVLAERDHLRVGDKLKATFGTKQHEFRVAGIATEYTFGGAVAYVERDVAKRLFNLEGVDSFLIQSTPDQVRQLEPQLNRIAEREGLLLQSFAQLVRLIDSMVNGVTGGLWVLLSLGLLVGALGVVNTLMMNVFEQTKEIGMLRSIGMGRRQIVKTVVGQAAFLGVIGIGAGVVSGISLARSINTALATMFGHPVPFALRPQFLLLLIGAGLALVLLSALYPGWRAARLNLIEAMRQD